VAPKFAITVEMQPSDEADFDAWYQKEHLDMLSKVPGYRCSKRYKLGVPVGYLTIGSPAPFLAIHEFDFLSGLGGPEAQECNGTEWTKRQIGAAKVFVVRAWERLFEQGFQSG